MLWTVTACLHILGDTECAVHYISAVKREAHASSHTHTQINQE